MGAKAARVAFMVTSTMRQELTERLSYSEEQIKRLTPLQASLILQHDVPSHEVSIKLPELENQHFEMQDAINQSATTTTVTQQQQQPSSNSNNNEVEEDANLVAPEEKTDVNEDDDDDDDTDAESKVEDKSNTAATEIVDKSANLENLVEKLQEDIDKLILETTTTLSASDSSVDDDDDDDLEESIFELQQQPTIEEEDVPVAQPSISFIDEVDASQLANISPDKIWYELVENDTADRESSVVGLYRDVTEAQLALETRELFERRRAKDKKKTVTTSFVITRVIR